MIKLEQIYRKLLGQLSKLDSQYQFAIVGGLLILAYLFQKLNKHRRRNHVQYKQFRQMANQLFNKDKQKRDGILWFFNLFLFTFFLTLFSYIFIYAAHYFQIKILTTFFSIIKLKYDDIQFYLKIGLATQSLICLILFKIAGHYSKKVQNQAIMTDSKVQEERDRLMKEQNKKETDTNAEIDLQNSVSKKKND
ncbi:hypothetical protein ABPG72_000913 [Tetrahymena utriculariae]